MNTVAHFVILASENSNGTILPGVPDPGVTQYGPLGVLVVAIIALTTIALKLGPKLFELWGQTNVVIGRVSDVQAKIAESNVQAAQVNAKAMEGFGQSVTGISESVGGLKVVVNTLDTNEWQRHRDLQELIKDRASSNR